MSDLAAALAPMLEALVRGDRFLMLGAVLRHMFFRRSKGIKLSSGGNRSSTSFTAPTTMEKLSM